MAGESGPLRFARNLIALYLRLALGVDFLSAVADRFGLWGQPGTDHVTWGNFSNFVAYVVQVDVFTSAGAAHLIAWVVTVAEILLGVFLIVGLFTRVTAILSGILLALFAVGMSLGTGAKSAFDVSIFAVSAGAFALAALGPNSWSIDAKRRKKKAAPPSQPPPPTSTAKPPQSPPDAPDQE